MIKKFILSFTLSLIQNSKNCIVSDRTHELFGKSVTNKVLIFPYPIGTTTLGFVLLETIVRKIGPKAIICAEGEPLMSSGAVIADLFFNLKFPIVDKIPFSELELIENGIMIRVNGNEGYVEIL
ncbi:MAG: aconitase X swivel domain-containing protein [Candidatus Thorarchaeota archaeon]